MNVTGSGGPLTTLKSELPEVSVNVTLSARAADSHYPVFSMSLDLLAIRAFEGRPAYVCYPARLGGSGTLACTTGAPRFGSNMNADSPSGSKVIGALASE